MDKTYPWSTLMIVWSLDPKKDPFHFKEDNEQIFDHEILYLNIISALMYLTQCTRPNITFSINILARFSS